MRRCGCTGSRPFALRRPPFGQRKKNTCRLNAPLPDSWGHRFVLCWRPSDCRGDVREAGRPSRRPPFDISTAGDAWAAARGPRFDRRLDPHPAVPKLLLSPPTTLELRPSNGDVALVFRWPEDKEIHISLEHSRRSRHVENRVARSLHPTAAYGSSDKLGCPSLAP